GNSILGNRLFSNVGLGIDLNFDAVTANDTGDVDGGPNQLQNFPVLFSARPNGGGTLISGALNSTPGAQFPIELFSLAEGHRTGFAEGDTVLGAVIGPTNSDGNINFTFQPPAPILFGRLVSATATNLATGDTSEFAQNVHVDNPGLLGFSAPTFRVGE